MITIEEYSKILEGVNGYICRNEGYKLYTLACECRGTQVLEIGALQGFSSIALALSGKHVLSIDLWDGADLSDSRLH